MAEIIAAVILRSSDGFTKFVPATAAVLAFAAAFYQVSLALIYLPVSTVYPIWAGGGTAGVALAGVLLLNERGHILKWLGIACVVTGIVLLNFASTATGP
jgi:small multidrug resistance pump